MNTKQALIEAKALITHYHNWLQHEHAQNREGASVNPQDADAYCFCADGALARVTGVKITDGDWSNTGPLYDAASQVLREAAESLYSARSYVEVNDGEDQDFALEPELCHARILAVFDEAIKKAA